MKVLLWSAFALVLALPPVTLRAEEKAPKPAPLVRLTSATVKGDELIGNSTVTTQEFVPQIQTQIVDGKAVNVTVLVPVLKTFQVTLSYPLKNTKATTLEGKEIAADDLAYSVKDVTVAVFPTASMPTEKQRKDFPKGTVFIEIHEKK